MKFSNHLSVGADSVRHKGKALMSALTNIEYQNFVENLDNAFEYEEVMVTPEVKHRPDLISSAFYDSVELDWLVLLCNNISNPFQGLNVGDRIRLPLL
tara:strand:+ start:8035 stop:8328 length:294 start_codon:yes stop_codon:yes gene_type:complete